MSTERAAEPGPPKPPGGSSAAAHADLFAERFEVQRRQEGFALIEARDGSDLAGFTFGVTLQPTTSWWHNLTAPLPPEVTAERPGRTFALVEMLVRAPAPRIAAIRRPRQATPASWHA